MPNESHGIRRECPVAVKSTARCDHKAIPSALNMLTFKSGKFFSMARDMNCLSKEKCGSFAVRKLLWCIRADGLPEPAMRISDLIGECHVSMTGIARQMQSLKALANCWKR